MASVTHHESVINGVRLHYVTEGEGPLVVLLHGFPDFWYVWRRQISALAAAGLRVAALDMRGYNSSQKPGGRDSYHMQLLVDDVVGLIHHLGEKDAALVGHDWGGAVAWHTATRCAPFVRSLVTLNAPHPAAYLKALRTLKQLKRSWYVLFFQIPWLPEKLLTAGNFVLFEQLLRRRMGLGDDDIAHYKRAFARGAMTAALNYYRAAFQPRLGNGRRTKGARITAPTLVIWGEQDPYLDISLTLGLERWVEQVRVERVANAGHWVQVDAPDRVNQLLIEFLLQPAGSQPGAAALAP